MLEAPLPGREVRTSPAVDESEGVAFMGLMAQAGKRQGIAGGA